MRAMTTMAAGLGLVLAVGCGGTISKEGTGGGGGTGGTGGTSNECAGFDDQKGTAPVTVRFRNETGQPIYLPVLCDQSIRYTIDLDAPNESESYVYERSCLQTCEDLQTQPQYACGACLPASFRLDPGATHDATWDGTGLAAGFGMPASCWESPAGQQQCSRVLAAMPGTYTVQATGSESCGADCTCDATGVCNNTPAGLAASADPATITFPSQGVVEVVFGVCAFGCAGEG